MADYAKTRSADWREQIRKNQSRTRRVVALFIALYLLIGLLIDIILVLGQDPLFYQSARNFSTDLGFAFAQLVTFKIVPYGTLTMALVALVSLWITFRFYTGIMLLGTHSKQITKEATDLQEKQLYNVVEEMKIAASMPSMPKVYLIEAAYMNAFASGINEETAMIAVTRGLINQLDRYELQAVIAHELSHIRHQDIRLALAASVLANIMLIVVDLFFYNAIFSRGKKASALVIFALVLRYVVPILTVFLTLYLSRTREYMADAGAVELTRDNEPLASALLKIHGDHLQNRSNYQHSYRITSHEELRRASYIYDPKVAGINVDDSLNSFFSTHPDLESRLRAIGYTRSESQ